MTSLNRIIINTVGASAYSNLNYKSQFQERYDTLTNLMKSPEGEDGSKKASQILLKLMHTNYGDPKSPIIPAEVSSLRALGVDKDKDLLYFVIGNRSDKKTDIGTACGRALHEYYEDAGYNVAPAYFVPDFIIDYTLADKPFVNPMRFLEKLVSLVEDLRRNHPGVRICINFTAGYKLNGVYAALVALRYGCESFYLQQEMGTGYAAPIFDPAILKLPTELDAEAFDNLNPPYKEWYQPTGNSYSLLTLEPVSKRSTEQRRSCLGEK